MDTFYLLNRNILKDSLLNSPPTLYGLVLAGGRSERMGEDKSQIVYHDLPQEEYEATLLQSYCDRVFISRSAKSRPNFDSNFDSIFDTFENIGPLGGLASAVFSKENSAWFTLPCDLPFVDDHLIKKVVSKRDSGVDVTCIYNHEAQRPEPLIAIWEPSCREALLAAVENEDYSLLNLLKCLDVLFIEIEDLKKIKNVNSLDEKREALRELKG